MIYLEKPESFNNPMEVVGCFVEYDGKILLLERNPEKSEGSMFCTPGGKVDKEDASREHAVARELFEETGLKINPDDFKNFTTFYVTHDHTGKHYLYHKYRLILDELPEVTLSPSEHINFTWVTPEEALALPLIFDEDNCIKHEYVYKK